MANSTGSEHQSSPRPPLRLVTSVLLLGTLLAWWGTRDHPAFFGESPRKPVAAEVVTFPQGVQQESTLLDRGAQISQRQCAGCHEMATRSVAPSYLEIATFYRHQLPASAGTPDLRSHVAAAVTHPRPGWGNFAPGPQELELSIDDRIALASWILNSVDGDKNAGKGVDK